MTKLTYAQLREILALTLTNGPIRVKLDALLAGREVSLDEGELIDLIVASEIDRDLIRILSGTDPDTLDAITALEYISDFFSYIRASSPKFTRWLKSSVSNPPNTHPKTRSKPSK